MDANLRLAQHCKTFRRLRKCLKLVGWNFCAEHQACNPTLDSRSNPGLNLVRHLCPEALLVLCSGVAVAMRCGSRLARHDWRNLPSFSQPYIYRERERERERERKRGREREWERYTCVCIYVCMYVFETPMANLRFCRHTCARGLGPALPM